MPGDSVWTLFLRSLAGHPGYIVVAFGIACLTFIGYCIIKSPQLSAAAAVRVKAENESLGVLTRVCGELKEVVDKLSDEVRLQTSHRTRMDRIIDRHEADIEELKRGQERHYKEYLYLAESFQQHEISQATLSESSQ